MDRERARSDLEYIRRTMQSVRRPGRSGARGPLMPEARMYCTVGALLIPLQLVPGLLLTRMYRLEHDGVT